MPVSKLALGMNARNYLYIRPNNRKIAKKRADDKLLTKKRLLKHNIPTPGLIEVFRNHRDVRKFDWKTLNGSFVVKPARGFGGGGIMVVRNWNGKNGKRIGKTNITVEELEAEIFSILDGAYSLDNLPDVAMLEKRVVVSNAMRKLTKKGVPDIRVIVYNKVPIMAMLRLPTEHSNGCANLHQGALGIGVDLRTGITTKGVMYGENEKYLPNSKTKVRGIKIPKWNKTLKYAAQAQKVSRLGFAGVDIVLDEEEGPLVLEVNARPGLQIQLANGDSLRTRLERIEGMDIPTVEYGIDLGKRLFAETALTDVPEKTSVVHVLEKVTIYGPKGKKTITAKLDTGAYSSSIDSELVHELGLTECDGQKMVRSGFGIEQVRERANILFRLHGKDIETDVSHIDRSHMRFPMIVGRRDLKGFLVDPTPRPDPKKKQKKTHKQKPQVKNNYDKKISPHI